MRPPTDRKQIVTEADLKRALDQRSIPYDDHGTLCVPDNWQLTPAARDLLRTYRADPAITDPHASGTAPEPVATSEQNHERGGTDKRFVILATGEWVDEKPEAFTHLRGRELVPKDHCRIDLRGMLDHLQSQLLEAQVMIGETGCYGLNNDLEEVLHCVRSVLRAEVLDEPLPTFSICGMDAAAVRAGSHDPQATFGIPHITPSWHHGAVLIALNKLRTDTRCVERQAVRAFHCHTEPTEQATKAVPKFERTDIILALNRLSSLIYILMLRYASGWYDRPSP